MNLKDKASVVLRVVMCALIVFSIFVTYYVMVVQTDYTMLTHPDGPDTSDYFEE